MLKPQAATFPGQASACPPAVNACTVTCCDELALCFTRTKDEPMCGNTKAPVCSPSMASHRRRHAACAPACELREAHTPCCCCSPCPRTQAGSDRSPACIRPGPGSCSSRCFGVLSWRHAPHKIPLLVHTPNTVGSHKGPHAIISACKSTCYPVRWGVTSVCGCAHHMPCMLFTPHLACVTCVTCLPANP